MNPFGGERVNPAQLAVHRVADCVHGAQIVKLDVPVVFGASAEKVCAAMRRERPDAVLCVGQAGGRSGLTPERVAINIDDSRIPDNAGQQPIDAASVSNSAGTCVCNHLMCGVLHCIAQEFPQMLGGFMHVPFAHEQALERGVPSMSIADIARGIEAALGGRLQGGQMRRAPGRSTDGLGIGTRNFLCGQDFSPAPSNVYP